MNRIDELLADLEPYNLETSGPDYDGVDALIEGDPIELGRRYRDALSHLSRFAEVTIGVDIDSSAWAYDPKTKAMWDISDDEPIYAYRGTTT